MNTHIEPGLFLLAAGSIVLALLNTFVVKAVRQSEREKSETARTARRNDKIVPDGSDETVDSSSSVRAKIHPVPVLFTDTFRWFLVRELPLIELRPTEEDDLDEPSWEDAELKSKFPREEDVFNESWDGEKSKSDEDHELYLHEQK